jgi:hypothetical protein
LHRERAVFVGVTRADKAREGERTPVPHRPTLGGG